MTRKTGLTLCFITVSVLLFGSGWYAHQRYQHYQAMKSPHIKREKFRFISPLMDFELPEGYSVRHEPIPFRNKIAAFVNQQISSGKMVNMSVYFRDLSDGPWFGINEQVEYNPASMMKVPVMIAWLKRAEKEPQILREELTFDEKSCPRLPQSIAPAKTLKDGASYTVEELLQHMLVYSDNKALWLLQSALTDEEFSYVLESMDVVNNTSHGNNSVTVHGYSGIYRILYNATFLNKQMSEKALQLLSLPDFTEGILAGVPKGTTVASKFGEWQDYRGADVKQLHEFGIVYHPKGPYILGVLTRGHDFAVQADLIRKISEMVYREVDVRKPVSK